MYDPIHYLPLLEQKIGALDQAAPLQDWDLPEEFGTLRRLLESRMGRRGKREYVQVLRLLESFSMGEVHSAIKDALRLGALSFDAVKHLLLCRLEGRPPRLGPGAVSLPAPGESEHDLHRRLHEPSFKEGSMTDKPTLLLEHHLKELRLPSFLREYRKMAAQCAAENVDHSEPICSGWPSWNSSTATSAWWSGGSARPGSLPSKAWTPSTFWPSPR